MNFKKYQMNLMRLAFFVFIMLHSSMGVSQNNTHKVNIVVFGGGKIDNELLLEFLSHTENQHPKLLIVPQAAKTGDREKVGERYKTTFENIGVNNIRILDLKNPQDAVDAIEWCDVVWVSGGSQIRLRKALEEAQVLKNLQTKIFDGYLMGGTSAGASIVSKVMMENNTIDSVTGKKRPIISYGLGIWENAIVDQHFSERNRFSRLELAVKVHPDLIGVGIDESTGVVYNGGNEFSVIGKGTVTVYQEESRSLFKSTDKLKITTLKKGDDFNF